MGHLISIGIDPGKNGGIAIIEPAGVAVFPFSQEALLNTLWDIASSDLITDTVVCVEKVGSMPGQGVVSTFNFGHGAGFIEGTLRALKIPYQLVPPAVWMKEFSITKDKDEKKRSKDKSIVVCQKLFPNVSLLASERCKKPHDGMAEALLIAEFARRRL